MKNLFKFFIPIGGILLASCAPDQFAMKSEYDDIYFSSADVRQVEYAKHVSNNQPQNFASYQNQKRDDVQLESFSAKNVNPDFVARYSEQSRQSAAGNYSSDDYFVENYGAQPAVNTTSNTGGLLNNSYDNFRVSDNRFANNQFGAFGWGNPMFYDPLMFDPFFAGQSAFFMRPGFGMSYMMNPWRLNRMARWSGMTMGFGFGWSSMTFGWGNPWMSPFMSPWGFDPFWGPGWGMNSWAMNSWGMSPWGWGGMGFGSPWINNNVIIIGDNAPVNNIVRGPRDGRSSQYNPEGQTVTPGTRTAAVPNTRSSIAAARSNAEGRQVVNETRDFSRTQNEYLQRSRRAGDGSAVGTNSRMANNVGSPATQTSRSYVPAASSRTSRTSSYGAPATQRSTMMNTGRTATSSPTRSTMNSANPSRSSSVGSSSSGSSMGSSGAGRSSGGGVSSGSSGSSGGGRSGRGG